MKNTVVGILTIIIVALMGFLATDDAVYHGGEHGKVIEDMGSKTANASSTTAPEEKDDREKEKEQLKALRDKAGNAGAFKVSQEYKSKCASCHGVNGEGIMGPKLFGQSADKVYKDLVDFKAGRKENYIMKGLLIKLEESDLRRLADEIGDFPNRAKESK